MTLSMSLTPFVGPRFQRRKRSIVVIFALTVVAFSSLFNRLSFLTPPQKVNHLVQSKRIDHTMVVSGSKEVRRSALNVVASRNRKNISDSRGERQRITVELVRSARLGNLMFGHAALLGLAERNDLDPIVSSTNRLLLSTFDLGIPSEERVPFGWKRCEEKFSSGYDIDVDEQIKKSKTRILLFGYFQSWKYFDDIRDRIVKAFRFKQSTRERANQIIETLTEKHSQRNMTLANVNRSDILRVGMHVRRGDMLTSISLRKGYTVASPGYLIRAMALMENRLISDGSVSLIYFVVSDDIPWCRRHITSQKFPIEFLSNEASIDLAILASCNHTIISVGTYGWWAAYLAGGITVYYKNFPANGSEISKEFHAEDYFHPTWIGLS